MPVRQFDLNIDFFRHIVAEETIEAQARAAGPPRPPEVRAAIDFARQYYEILRASPPPGYRQRFSEDAEQLLLSRALAIFNHHHPEATFSTLGVYHAGDAEDSNYIADLAARDAGNPFAAFFRGGFLQEVARELPGVVGISVCGGFQLGAAFTLARQIKEIEPRIHVVIGGAFFSTLPEVLLNLKTAGNLFRHVDAFIFNEGEIPFLRLAREVLSGQPPSAAPNVMLRRERALRYEPCCCLPPGEIAGPVFPDGAIEKYFRPAPRIPVEVSRGCYWGKCTFCNLSSGSNARYRGLPIDSIFHTLRTLTRRHRAAGVLFSTLAMAPKILRSVAAGLLQERMDLSWSAWIRPEKTLTEADLDLFQESGCTSLAVTPESFGTNTLSRMQKGFELEHLVRIVGQLRDRGLCGEINIIPGFPGETPDDFMATMEVCRSLGLRGEFFPFCLLKNSEIHRAPDRFGVAVHEDPEKDLAVAVPFTYARDPAAPTGVQLIGMAARRYPGQVFADSPLDGYTFDFSARPQ